MFVLYSCLYIVLDEMNVTHRNTEILRGTLMCRISPTVTNSRMDSGGCMNACIVGPAP